MATLEHPRLLAIIIIFVLVAYMNSDAPEGTLMVLLILMFLAYCVLHVVMHAL
jgi:hypothetical protein